ncbi:MAG: metallophosphoesterase, partial [Spirochaetaceae bacterium]|nr:metallophosphoesterase [Spirochaetaceae bacterium]
ALSAALRAALRATPRGAPKELATIASLAAITFAAASIAVDAGFFVWISSTSSRSTAASPLSAQPAGRFALRGVDPRQGISASGGASGDVVRLSISSDPHWGSPTSDSDGRKAVIRGVASARPRPDAFLILGDNVERGMDEEPWLEEARELSSLLADMPVVALMGNHDALVNGEKRFLAMFPAALSSDSGSPLYYAMDAGAARVVVLNLLWGTDSFDSAQRAWLEKTLRATPKGQQVIVLSHCFFYSSGYVVPDTGMPWYDHFETIPGVTPLFEQGGVDLVISGHNHYMELLEKNGVTYALVGAMGGLLDPPPDYHSPASLWLGQGILGRLDLEISASGIALAFRDRDGASLREAFLPIGDRSFSP